MEGSPRLASDAPPIRQVNVDHGLAPHGTCMLGHTPIVPPYRSYSVDHFFAGIDPAFLVCDPPTSASVMKNLHRDQSRPRNRAYRTITQITKT